MAPIDWNLLPAFVAVFETGGFTPAGERLRQPRSSVSRAVTALEKALGYALFQRTTRMVQPTEEARGLYDRIIGSVHGLSGALDEAVERKEAVAGTVRVTTTADLGRALLADLVTRFAARYPKVVVQVVLTTRVVDLLKERFDFALRVTNRRMASSGLVARKVGTLTLDLYATPAYLARAGTPRSPRDLAQHQLVHFEDEMRLRALLPQDQSAISLRPRIISDDMAFIHDAVLRDAGIAVMPRFLAQPEVARGALVRVLPKWSTVTGALMLVQPSRHQVPPRVALFRAALLEHLRTSSVR